LIKVGKQLHETEILTYLVYTLFPCFPDLRVGSSFQTFQTSANINLHHKAFVTYYI